MDLHTETACWPTAIVGVAGLWPSRASGLTGRTVEPVLAQDAQTPGKWRGQCENIMALHTVHSLRET